MSSETVEGKLEEHRVKKSCNDILFALLYLGCFGLTLALTFLYGADVMKSVGHLTNSTISSEQPRQFTKLFEMTAFISGGGAVFTLLWTLLMLCCGSMLIWMAVFVVVAGNICFGIFGTKLLYEQNNKFYWWPAVVCGLMAFLLLAYVCCIRNRIAFASANLRIACSIILSYPCTIALAFFFVAIQIGWSLLWSVATYAALHHRKFSASVTGVAVTHYSTGQQFGIVAGMVLIYFWTSFVLKNIVTVTTAGTVASYWHQPTASLSTVRSLGRSLTYNFGSICFGSLLVSILECISFLLSCLSQLMSNSGNCVAACLAGCLSCCVGCVSRMVQYFNKFAYAYVGIYGDSFLTSGKKVMQLFSGRGWSAIANDSLLENVLFVGCVVVGCLCACAGWAIVVYTEKSKNITSHYEYWGVNHPKQILGLTGFLIGYGITNVLMTLISGTVACIFVLFAEDPEVLSRTHTEEHDALVSAWTKIYPEEYAGRKENDGKQVEMTQV